MGELKKWLKQKWVRIGTDGEIKGPCGTSKDKKSPDNFMTHMKNKIDELNVRRTMNRKVSYSYPFKDNEVRFNNSTNSISFYENVVVLEKLEMPKAREIRKDK